MSAWLDDGDVQLYHGDACEVLRSLPAGSVQTCVTSPPYWGLRDYGTGSWTGGDTGCDHLGPPKASTKSGLKNDGRPVDLVGQNDYERAARVPYGDVCGRCGARRVDAQLGLERTPTEYVAALVAVFAEVWRVLRDDGTLWLNLGDSYATTPPGNKTPRDQRPNEGPFRIPSSEALAARERHSGTLAPGLKAKDLVGIPWRVAFALQEAGWYLWCAMRGAWRDAPLAHPMRHMRPARAQGRVA